jgi:hypothetical protein
LAEVADGHTGALQQDGGDAVGLGEQGREKMLDVHALVVPSDRQGLGISQGFLRFRSEPFDVHGAAEITID